MRLYSEPDTIILHRRRRCGCTVGVLAVILIISSRVMGGQSSGNFRRSALRRITSGFYGRFFARETGTVESTPKSTVLASREATRPAPVDRQSTGDEHRARRTSPLTFFNAPGTLTNGDIEALNDLGRLVDQLFSAFSPHTCESKANTREVTKNVRGTVETQWLYKLARRLLYTGPTENIIFPVARPATVLSAVKGRVRVFYRVDDTFWSLQYDSGERLFPEVFSSCLESGKMGAWAASVKEYLTNKFRVEQALELLCPHAIEEVHQVLTTKDIILLPHRKSYIVHKRGCLYINGFIMHRPGLIGLEQIVKLTKGLQSYLFLTVTYGRAGLTLQILHIVQSIRRRGLVLPRFTVGDFYVSPEGVLLLKLPLPLMEEKSLPRDDRTQENLNTTDTGSVLQTVWNFTEHSLKALAGERNTHFAEILPVPNQVAIIIRDLNTLQWHVKDVDTHPRFATLAKALSND